MMTAPGSIVQYCGHKPLPNHCNSHSSSFTSPYPFTSMSPTLQQELNRSQKDCRSKWTTLQRSVSIQEMKKGPFTPEEDIIVMQRVAEWGDKGQVRC